MYVFPDTFYILNTKNINIPINSNEIPYSNPTILPKPPTILNSPTFNTKTPKIINVDDDLSDGLVNDVNGFISSNYNNFNDLNDYFDNNDNYLDCNKINPSSNLNLINKLPNITPVIDKSCQSENISKISENIKTNPNNYHNQSKNPNNINKSSKKSSINNKNPNKSINLPQIIPNNVLNVTTDMFAVRVTLPQKTEVDDLRAQFKYNSLLEYEVRAKLQDKHDIRMKTMLSQVHVLNEKSQIKPRQYLYSTRRQPTLNRIRTKLPDHLGYIKCQYLGEHIALYDTGASINAIDWDFAHKNLDPSKIKKRSQGLTTATAGGDVKLSYYYQDTILHNNRFVNTEFYLVKNLGYNLILGRQLLKLLGYQLVQVNELGEKVNNQYVHKADLSHLYLDEEDIFYNRIDYSTTLDGIKDYSNVESHGVITKTTIGTDSTLIANHVRELIHLTQSVIAQSEADVGCIPDVSLKLKLKPGAKPFAIKQPYNLHPDHQVEAKRQIDLLLAAGWISESKSPWAGGVTFSQKKSGGLRMCTDLRQLNIRIVDERFPMPKITDLLQKFQGNKYFTSLDLKSGYFHIDVDKVTRPLLAFLTPWGLYEWNRMPFGVKTAPIFFQRAMTKVFEGLDFVQVYLDDIIILSKTEQDHISHLTQVFDRLKKYNLKLRLDKCMFGVTELEYLGHLVNGHTQLPTPAYKGKIINCKVPDSKKALESFLGLCNWIARFIPILSELTRPLYTLTHKNTVWRWGEKEQKLFDRIKHEINNIKALKLPDLNKKFYVETDASIHSLGAVLLQKDEKGLLQPVEWLSKSFDQTQINWSIGEKECFAAIYAIEKWEKYLKPNHFVLYTDHKNLALLFNFAKIFKGNKLWRWALRLQEYTFTVTARPGSEQIISDYLSRYNTHYTKTDKPLNRKVIEFTDKENIHYATAYDPEIYLLHNRRQKTHCEAYRTPTHNESYDFARNISMATYLAHNTNNYLSTTLDPTSVKQNKNIFSINIQYPTFDKTKLENYLINKTTELNEEISKLRQPYTLDNLNIYDINHKITKCENMLYILKNRELKRNITQQYIFDEKSSTISPYEDLYPVTTRSMARKAREQAEQSKNTLSSESTQNSDSQNSTIPKTKNLTSTPEIVKNTGNNDISPPIVTSDTHVQGTIHNKPDNRPKNDESKSTTLNQPFTNWLRSDNRYHANNTVNLQDIDPTELKQLQLDDVVCFHIRNYVLQTKPENKQKHLKSLPKVFRKHLIKNKHYNIKNNILYYDDKIYCPAQIRTALIQYIHNQYNHIRYGKMLRIMTKKYYWPDMKLDIQNQLGLCDICYQCSGQLNKIIQPLKTFPSEKPFQVLHIDLIGPFAKSKNGFQYALTMCDRFTRYLEIVPLKNMTAKTCAQAIVQKWICTFGIPQSIISDQGTQFEGHIFTHLCRILNIKRRRTTAYRPMANGRLERIHREIKKHLRVIAASNQLNFVPTREHPAPVDNWDSYLDIIKFKLNCTPSQITGKAPIQLILGFVPTLPEDYLLQIDNDTQKLRTLDQREYLRWLHHTKTILLDQAVEQQAKYDTLRKNRHDKNISLNIPQYKVGDIVRYYVYDANKLSPQWSQPYRILRFEDDYIIKIAQIANPKIERVVNIDHIKLATRRHIPDMEQVTISAPNPKLPTVVRTTQTRKRARTPYQQQTNIDIPQPTIPSNFPQVTVPTIVTLPNQRPAKRRKKVRFQ